MQAFFANTAAKDDLVLTSEQAVKHYREQLAVWEEKTRDIRDQMEAIEAPKRKALEEDYFEKYPAEILICKGSYALRFTSASDVNSIPKRTGRFAIGS